MPTPDAAPRPRPPRGRRQLRTRIILSFALFGFALTTLIAATTVYLRNRVENTVLGAALEKNNNMFAEGFYRNPDAVGIPFEKIQGLQVSTRKRDKVRAEWRDLPNGVHDSIVRDPAAPRPTRGFPAPAGSPPPARLPSAPAGSSARWG